MKLITNDLLQYPILSITIGYLHYDFRYANILFASISVLLFAEPLYLWRVDAKKEGVREKEREREKERLGVRGINASDGSVFSDSDSVTIGSP